MAVDHFAPKYIIQSKTNDIILHFSTVQSVLFRFGLDNKLNFVLPSDGNHLNDPSHRFILTENFKTEWLDQEKEKIPWHETLYKEKKYDIFNLHTVWNQTATRYL